MPASWYLPPAGPVAVAAEAKVTLGATEFAFQLVRATAPARHITVRLDNQGAQCRTWVVERYEEALTLDVLAGQTNTGRIRKRARHAPDTLCCEMSAHRQAGLGDRLTVAST